MCLWSPSFRREHLVIVFGICWLIYVVGGSALGAEHMFNGVYTGNRLLTKGSGSSCAVEQDVLITINSETLSFTGSNLRKFDLGFYPREDGSFGLIYVNPGGATVNIRGHVIGDVIEADVISPPCEYHWHPTKEHQVK
jgi:hypothetical protein